MTTQLELERLLDDWMVDGPRDSPPAVMSTVATRIATERRRPPVRAGATGRLMTTPMLMAGAVVVVATIGVGLLAGAFLGIPGPATLMPAGSASAGPTIGASLPSGVMPAGTYQSRGFSPPVRYTTPQGWFRVADESTYLALTREGPDAPIISLSSGVYPPDLGPDGCMETPGLEGPRRASDLLAYLTDRPGITADVAPASLGGLDGWSVRITLDETWRSPCDGEASLPVYISSGCCMIPMATGIGPGTTSLVVLDDGHDQAVVLEIRGDPTTIAEAEAIVATFEFQVRPEPSATTSAQPTEATSASPTATISLRPSGAPPPGMSTTLIFEPELTFTLPTGWSATEESRALVTLSHPDLGEVDVVSTVFAPRIDDRGCQTGIVMGERQAENILAYWASHPGIDSSEPRSIPVGDLTGWLVIVSQRRGWSNPCDDMGPVDFLHLWNGVGVPFGSGLGGVPKTLVVLETTDGATIGIKWHDTPALHDEVMAIVESFSFDDDPDPATASGSP